MIVPSQPPLAGWTAGQTMCGVASRRRVRFDLFSSAEFTGVFATLITGTSPSHQRVKPESLLKTDAVIAPGPLFERFPASASGSLELVSRNIREFRTLPLLRDALLPKLLSGELRMPCEISPG
jgi:type I restriction enzyme S subunit